MTKKADTIPQRAMRKLRLRPYNQQITLVEHVQFLLAEQDVDFPSCPKWPADIFAIAASLLARAGAYASILNTWPPAGTTDSWTDHVKNIAEVWRKDWKATPPEVERAWESLIPFDSLPIHEICKKPSLMEALMVLSSVADETCVHVGIPIRWKSLGVSESEFYLKALRLLRPKSRGSSLCDRIHPTRARVLPKMHTPQSGMTIRSLSLNLALILSDEIVPKWNPLAQPLRGEAFNVLFVPWPFEIPDGAIHECVPLPQELGNMPPHFGFFTYDPIEGVSPTPFIEKLLAAETANGQKIHAVVLPELALTPSQFKSLATFTSTNNMHLIAGVCGEAGPNGYPRNELKFASPDSVTFTQQKHHRWKLNDKQIKAYKLTDELDIDREWWEHIDISSREFNFFALGDGLVVSALICEDLARPDPVGDLIRAVGPNLVVALLMDGPQIQTRWPFRYAASLAEDPGSSVLSVTSLGMSLRSKREEGDRSRVVALWHSPNGDWEEIELLEDHGAIIMSFEKRQKQEWVVDGRDDAGQGSYLYLHSKRMLRIETQVPAKASK